MDWTIVTSVSAIAVASATAFAYFIKARTDWLQGSATAAQTDRDDVQQLLTLKDEIIEALRAQNEDLEQRLKRQDIAVEELKKRLALVEEEYRTLLRTAVESGICVMAPSCPNYSPPGSRSAA